MVTVRVVSSFRSVAIGCCFLLATLVGILMLAYDDLLRITPNYHWVVVIAFCVMDAILGVQVLMTAAVGVWEKIAIRVAAVWSLFVLVAVLGDVVLTLQLPADYPIITVWQSFQYLFLGLNGNPVPFAVPALFTLQAIAALLGLVPGKGGSWFHVDSLPTRKTIVAIALIALVVMGMRPTYLFLGSNGLLSTVVPASSKRDPDNTTSSEAISLALRFVEQDCVRDPSGRRQPYAALQFQRHAVWPFGNLYSRKLDDTFDLHKSGRFSAQRGTDGG